MSSGAENSAIVGFPTRLAAARRSAAEGNVGTPTVDIDGDVDIVERALAIVDEETRSWATRQRALAAPAEVTRGMSGRTGRGQ